MGTQVGRIEKEFVFKLLIEDEASCDVHKSGAEVRCRFKTADDRSVTLGLRDGSLEGFQVGDEVRVFFFLKNNYHTFSTRIISIEKEKLVLEQPKGVYKNLQRKYERIKAPEDIEISFGLKGKKIELSFPKSERFEAVEPPELSQTFNPHSIHELMKGFRAKVEPALNAIIMFRDRLPRTWEEKLIAKLGKSLWIPSTAEDFPFTELRPEEQIITKSELIKFEEDLGVDPRVIQSKLGNVLYEKSKKGLFSELYCPILYNEYVVGYIYVATPSDKRERISRDIFDYTHQFAKVLCYSLVKNGYFHEVNAGERKYEAPIIDLSASGLLFTHPSDDLSQELHVHSDLTLTLHLQKRTIAIGASIVRKFKDSESVYFGALFMKMAPEDFRFLFEYLYGKPFEAKYDMTWEGGAPPPEVQL